MRRSGIGGAQDCLDQERRDHRRKPRVSDLRGRGRVQRRHLRLQRLKLGWLRLQNVLSQHSQPGKIKQSISLW